MFSIKWDGERYRVSIPNYDGGDVLTKEEHEQALAEKDREIEAKATELGTLDAELIVSRAAYQQLMANAVRFAEAYRNAHLSDWLDLVAEEMSEEMAMKDPVYVEAQAFLKEHS